MKFTKMHSLGNDYVCINGFSEQVSTPEKLAKTICEHACAEIESAVLANMSMTRE